MTTNITAFARVLLVAFVAAAIIVPQVTLADGIDYNGYKPVGSTSSGSSASYNGYKPVSSGGSYPSATYGGSSGTKYPTNYYSGSSGTKYPSYSYSYDYPKYNSYSSCGYYYDCGGSDINFSWNDNSNSNSNSNYNYNYNSNINQNGGNNYQSNPVCALSASDTSIEEGDSTTLHWTSEGAYSATLSGYGSVNTGGSRTVSPSNTQNYTLTVYGSTGGKDVCSVTVHVDEEDEDEDDLWCELSVDDRTVDDGDEVTLEWDTRGADYASINQGVGRVDEDGGEEDVEVDGDTTFRLTVRDDDGDEETCSVSVRVDEDNDFSSVVYVDEPSNNPPPTVYLSSIPYTGLEDISPDILMYWLLLIAGAGAAVWFAVSKGLVPNVFAYATTDGHAEPEAEVMEEAPATGHVNQFVWALAEGDEEAVMAHLRTAAVDGTGVEEYLANVRTGVLDTDPLAAKLDAMILGSQATGIRGAKAAFAA